MTCALDCANDEPFSLLTIEDKLNATTSMILGLKARRLTSIQMARKLPRVLPINLTTISPSFKHQHSSSPSSATTPTSEFLTFLYYPNNPLLSPTILSLLNMENHPQGTQEALKDQLREGYCKEACEYNPSKHVSDHILPHILNLYASRATAVDFEIYAPHATFEDPLMHANGVKQIKSAFYSLSKVFSESRIVDYNVKENVICPGKTEILIDNNQYYNFLGKDINMVSLIKLYTENGKVIRHEDWWEKKPLWNRETVKFPLVGRMIEVTRRASMMATHGLMGFGKDPTS